MAKKTKKKGDDKPKRRKSRKAGKADMGMLITIVISAILSFVAAPKLASKFPTMSKFVGPIIAGVGYMLVKSGKKNTTPIGLGAVAAGGVLTYNAWQANNAAKAAMANGPARVPNGPARVPMPNGPARLPSARKSSYSSITGGPSI